MNLRKIPFIQKGIQKVVSKTVPIDLSNEFRWVIFRQYHSPFVNHPFWVRLQKRIWLHWSDVAEVDKPFYATYDDNGLNGFYSRVILELENIKYPFTILPSQEELNKKK